MNYIIFDIDGTLTNTVAVDDKCYINSFESLFGISLINVKWSDLKNVTDWGITEELVRIKLKREIEEDQFIQLKQIFISALQDELKKDRSQFLEIPGATNFFNNLMANPNFEIGIATGGWEESANLKLNCIGIDPDTNSFSSSNHFKRREDITLDVIDQIKTKTTHSADQIIYFGDGEWDYKTCQKLGIRFIGIDSQMNNKLSKIGAKEIYTDFKNPDEIMKSIISRS